MGDWNCAEDDNAAYRLARNATFRILNPLVLVQEGMFHWTYTIAKEYPPKDKRQAVYWYWRCASDLQTDFED